jgi:hypothetical protein
MKEIVINHFKMLYASIIAVGIGVFRVLFGIGNILKEVFKEGIKNNVSFALTQLQKVINTLERIINLIKTVMSRVSSIPSMFGGGGGGGGDTTIPSPTIPKMDDFIWRSGQGIAHINPNDNIVGTKDGVAGGKSITYSPVYYINVSDKVEMERMIEHNNKKVVDDLFRLIKPTGV